MEKQKGFTLIELIVVVVILGILAAVAVPKFVDLSSEADAAAVKGVAGGISSAAAVNYAGRVATVGGTRKGVVYNSATPCAKAALDTILQTPLDTTKYTSTAVGTVTCATAAAGTTETCTIASVRDATKTATATVICVD